MFFIGFKKSGGGSKKPDKRMAGEKPSEEEMARRKFMLLKEIAGPYLTVELEFVKHSDYTQGLKKRRDAALLKRVKIRRAKPSQGGPAFVDWNIQYQKANREALDAEIPYLTELVDFAKRKGKQKKVVSRFQKILDRKKLQRKKLQEEN